ncbi:protein-ADP-ribose hydrolase [Actinomadura sp. LD22]|uniref:Protein-ADP-ribose hydrolase n=2 Tax=Actinomadura physcomitrii TaxID=2650748 RepID=A0A6I4MKF2_9ACTN|nr:protein-ADP-ribose hydrolase [Actinomadura physcomitrii]
MDGDGGDPGRCLQIVLAELERDGTAAVLSRSLQHLSGDLGKDRELLRALLTIRGPRALSGPAEAALDLLLEAERADRTVVAPATLPRTHGRVVIWRGDTTLLGADAVVNAANDRMLGCFIPFHRCIDNAIHSAAGPRLRRDCDQLMRLQRQAIGLPTEPTGRAKATRGYHLPARYVIHTVGPIVHHTLTAAQREALASCYRSCLDLAARLPSVRSIGICAISTGVFGFPRDAAARIAVATVDTWLAEHPGRLDQIVLNPFTSEDEVDYRNAAADHRWEHA